MLHRISGIVLHSRKSGKARYNSEPRQNNGGKMMALAYLQATFRQLRTGVCVYGLGAALLLGGCAGTPESELVPEERPVAELFAEAQGEMGAGRYQAAAAGFEEVERQHPYSALAVRAQILSAYAYYLDRRYEDAIGSLQRYIELNPGSSNIAYAHFLLAMCYYEQISDVERDQDITRQALQRLEDVARLFPQSVYARDAQLKIDLTIDHLAGKEMEIGRFYQRKANFVGAINRYRVVVEQFDQTTHVPEALYRISEAYLAMGFVAEARRNAAVLGHNYPQTIWYRRGYELFQERAVVEDDGWFARVFGLAG